MENRGRYPVMIVADNPRRLIAGFVREEALLRAGMNGAKKDMSPPLAVEIPGTKKGLLSVEDTYADIADFNPPRTDDVPLISAPEAKF